MPKPALTEPKSSVVVITLNPAAQEQGVSYPELVGRAKGAVSLEELGIENGINFKRAVSGGVILELPGANTGAKADLLADKIKAALSDVAKVVRPLKCADLRISGLDDATRKEEIAAAVASKGGCALEQVRVGDIRMGPRGVGVVVVQCPVAAAKTLSDAGRLLIGWSSTQVQALGAKPLRCYKCMGLGHTRPQCTATVDRGILCYRCGALGHKSESCVAEPHCAVCTSAGLPAGHIMGGRNCEPPVTRGNFTAGARPSTGLRPASAANRAASASQPQAMTTD